MNELVKKVVDYIEDNYDDDDVADMIEKRSIECAIGKYDEDDGKAEALDWYSEFGEGKAEAGVLDSLIDTATTDLDIELDSEDQDEIIDELVELYDL